MGGKTKICLYGPYPPPYGGLTTQTLSLYKQLNKEGIKVSRISYTHKINEMLYKKCGIRSTYFTGYIAEKFNCD